jgi:hypothetical protein
MDSMLLSPSTNGGNIAREGFDYQDDYILLNLGNWLACSGFCEFFNESLGDIEVGYLTAKGPRRVCYEAKKTTLSPAEVWNEMCRFKEIFDKGDGLYTYFVLVMPDMPPTLLPLKSMLDTLRVKGSNFATGSTIYTEARDEAITWIKQKNQSAALAEFVAEYVCIENFILSNADREFQGSVTSTLPRLNEVTGRKLEVLRLAWKMLIERSVKGAVSRMAVEDHLLDALESDADIWRDHPTEIHLATGPSTSTHGLFDVCFNLIPFTDDGRHERTNADWQALVTDMETIGSFLRSSRPRRRIVLNAELRMSAAIAAGHAFRAVKGHELHIRHRDNVYAISDIVITQASSFECHEHGIPGQSSEGVAGIQIGLALKPHLDQACVQYGLQTNPLLLITTESPVLDSNSLNELVHEAKRALAIFKAERNLSKIHLFVKAPSFFAMALGYRLNGLGTINLYDWAGSDYRPTLVLETSK